MTAPSDTPRTDEASRKHPGQLTLQFADLRDCARALERELAEAHAALTEISPAVPGETTMDAVRRVETRMAELEPEARRYTALKQLLRNYLMLELHEPSGGTEGRDMWMLWFLPFKRDYNNQFHEIIKYGISGFRNSYDHLALEFFRLLLSDQLDAVLAKEQT